MQRNVKNKVTFFTFGLLAGLTIGVVFAVAIKELFSHLNSLKQVMVNLGSKEDKMSQRIDSLEGKIQSQDKKTVVMVVNKNNSKTTQPVLDNNHKATSDSNTVKKIVKDGRDSVLNLELNNDSNVGSNVVVMTNQLVTVSNISLVDLDSTHIKKSKAAKESDSLIASLNEMGQATTSSAYRIEFWVSPINFRGYKMSMGKIVLYGVSSKVPLKLVKWDDSYYLQADQVVYKIDYTDDLRPFDKVTDKTILKKFSL